ncbi:MAG: transcription termination/antitermination NusG family protein [Caulobacteraceae bacterium]|nr:transcription termination/antitermination NusG family protein [Caulobacteraceae bacterium]
MNAEPMKAVVVNDLDARWYIARTNHKQERLARASLMAEKLEVYLPMMPKRNRMGELYATPLFPGFIFVSFMLGGAGWTKVFSARGVSSVLGTGGKPQSISTGGLEQIRGREVEAFERVQLIAPACHALKPGDKILFKKGPWAELEAVFLKQNNALRCAVLVRLLGSERLAEAEMAHIA